MNQKYKILVLDGDGIGPEICSGIKTILQKIASRFNHTFEFEHGLVGHAAIVETGDPLPPETLVKAKNCDAILFGAIGHPMYENNPKATVTPEKGLLKLRSELGLFANLRPIQIFAELSDASPLKPELLNGVDILFFRELTGGIYFGQPRERSIDGERAVDTCVYTKDEVRRIAIMAFESALSRKQKVTSVDKANVLETSRLWRETVNEVAKDYPSVTLEHQLVDSMAMKLIQNPSQYDVVLTENMFGDILTDEASQITGSLGMLASASIGSKVGLFEPIHGSAPDIAGLDIANPIATILSSAMLLRMGLKLPKEADCIEQSVQLTLAQGWRTVDIATKNTPQDKILGTQKMSAKILENLDLV
jgi:3-isopropylmalate dehydrogenase